MFSIDLYLTTPQKFSFPQFQFRSAYSSRDEGTSPVSKAGRGSIGRHAALIKASSRDCGLLVGEGHVLTRRPVVFIDVINHYMETTR